jgi:hypothetical protein
MGGVCRSLYIAVDLGRLNWTGPAVLVEVVK